MQKEIKVNRRYAKEPQDVRKKQLLFNVNQYEYDLFFELKKKRGFQQNVDVFIEMLNDLKMK